MGALLTEGKQVVAKTSERKIYDMPDYMEAILRRHEQRCSVLACLFNVPRAQSLKSQLD